MFFASRPTDERPHPSCLSTRLCILYMCVLLCMGWTERGAGFGWEIIRSPKCRVGVARVLCIVVAGFGLAVHFILAILTPFSLCCASLKWERRHSNKRIDRCSYISIEVHVSVSHLIRLVGVELMQVSDITGDLVVSLSLFVPCFFCCAMLLLCFVLCCPGDRGVRQSEDELVVLEGARRGERAKEGGREGGKRHHIISVLERITMYVRIYSNPCT